MPASKRKKTVNVADIESVVARIARIPEKSVSQSDRDTLRTLGNRLKMLVFGQDKAIEALTEAIKMARAGLGHDTSLSVPSCSLARPASGKPR
jgi:ATP-dependent Clp protease ATP-binding subunit ClpA